MSVSSQNQLYLAIIGDIKNSRSIDERGVVQDKLRNILQEVNQKYAADIAAGFMITLGDEFQGLLVQVDHTMQLIEEIRLGMLPVRIRFGVGIGAITTSIDPQMAIGADGPCFYKARSAIDYLKKSEKLNKTKAANIRFEMQNDRYHVDALNTILTLLSVITEDWTKHQVAVIQDYSQYHDSQKNCAKRLGITQSTVQRSLTSSNYYAYQEALNTINSILGEIPKNAI